MFDQIQFQNWLAADRPLWSRLGPEVTIAMTLLNFADEFISSTNSHESILASELLDAARILLEEQILGHVVDQVLSDLLPRSVAQLRKKRQAALSEQPA